MRAAALTKAMRAMLVAANYVSLPGDGLRIKGSGQHATAGRLAYFGLLRVARPADGRKAHVHVTAEGRKAAEKIVAAKIEALRRENHEARTAMTESISEVKS